MPKETTGHSLHSFLNWVVIKEIRSTQLRNSLPLISITDVAVVHQGWGVNHSGALTTNDELTGRAKTTSSSPHLTGRCREHWEMPGSIVLIDWGDTEQWPGKPVLLSSIWYPGRNLTQAFPEWPFVMTMEIIQVSIEGDSHRVCYGISGVLQRKDNG